MTVGGGWSRLVRGVALAGGLVVLAAFGETALAGSPAPAGPKTVARYDFDAKAESGSVADGTGLGHTMRVLAEHGGVVTTSRGNGHALRFPAKCAGSACPRAVLQATNSADLNPGTAPIAYGASILLAADQTTSGQNVLQKGYSTGGGQYKLQIDGAAGRPSCVLTDDSAPTIHIVRSNSTVADGQWHRLECRRSGAAFSIVVDGAVRATATVPATLSVLNDVRLSLGGKGTGVNNDQFQGTLDDVWIAVG